MPASPTTTTARTSPERAARYSSTKAPNSASRPTKGIRGGPGFALSFSAWAASARVRTRAVKVCASEPGSTPRARSPERYCS